MLNQLYKKLNSIKLPIWVKVLFSLVFVGITLVVNELGQNFCTPVTWFLIVLIIIAICFISYPILTKFKKAQRVVLLVNSLLLWVYVFALIFSVNGIYLDGLLPLGLVYVAYLLFFPSLVLIITIRRIKRQWDNRLKKQFIALHTVVILFFTVAMVNYYTVAKQIHSVNTIEEYQEIKNQSVISNYYVERIVGLHFIYHTRLGVYDGWRPPLLDLVIALGTTFFGDPIDNIRRPILSNLAGRIKIYKTLYPNKPIVQSCKCSQATPENYFIDLEQYK